MARRRKKSLADYSPRALAGLKGYWMTCIRHFDANPRQMTNWLIWKGLMAQDPMAYNGAWSKWYVPDRLPRHWTPPPVPEGIEPPF
jgi:hypothetical protein